MIFSKKLLRTTNYHHTKSCLVPIYTFCIIIILSFTMTVGILMLHCGLGMRNMNTFYTFRCPQSLEMIRLYLYKNCKLERDMTLCGDNWLYEETSLKKSGSFLLNSARKQ
jgi:hypothetical protein